MAAKAQLEQMKSEDLLEQARLAEEKKRRGGRGPRQGGVPQAPQEGRPLGQLICDSDPSASPSVNC